MLKDNICTSTALKKTYIKTKTCWKCNLYNKWYASGRLEMKLLQISVFRLWNSQHWSAEVRRTGNYVMGAQITNFIGTVLSRCSFQTRSQRVCPLQLAAGLWWRHQAVQEAVAQGGVTSGQVVIQKQHVHLVQLFVQQPIQEGVRHRLQSWFRSRQIRADVHTGSHRQVSLVWYQWRRRTLWLQLSGVRLTANVRLKTMAGVASLWVLGHLLWADHLKVWILLQEATVSKDICKVSIWAGVRRTHGDCRAYGLQGLHLWSLEQGSAKLLAGTCTQKTRRSLAC